MDHSHQSLKLLVGRFKFRIAMMNDPWRSALERLFGRNPRKPSLLGQLFVRGKIEAYEKADFSIGCRRWLFHRRLARFSRSCFALGLFRRFSFGFRRWRRLCRRFGLGDGLNNRALGAIQLILQLFVEAKSLPPAVQLVPRLLRPLLVRAKIKSNIAVSHDSSLRRPAIQVKLEHSAAVRARREQRRACAAVRDSRDWRIV